jgi:hypothetical protein
LFSCHLDYGAEPLRAFLQAGCTFDAFILVDYVDQPFAPTDCFHRASAEANTTAGAFIGQDIEAYERLAH